MPLLFYLKNKGLISVSIRVFLLSKLRGRSAVSDFPLRSHVSRQFQDMSVRFHVRFVNRVDEGSVGERTYFDVEYKRVYRMFCQCEISFP
jgi:hypothetical protein